LIVRIMAGRNRPKAAQYTSMRQINSPCCDHLSCGLEMPLSWLSSQPAKSRHDANHSISYFNKSRSRSDHLGTLKIILNKLELAGSANHR